jgi:hypothetical protein
MFRLNPVLWFDDLKTKAKLLTAFGLVSVIIVVMTTLGVWTNERLRQHAEAIYVDYTVPLIDFNTMLSNAGKYNRTLQDLAKATNASDILVDLGKLDQYKKGVETTILAYEATLLRVSSTGRDETKDLVELKAVFDNYFRQADAGIAALSESFDSKSLSAPQAQQMRELGQLALTVGIAPAYEQVLYRHSEQIKTLQAVAKDLNDEAAELAANGTLALVVGGTIAVLLGLGIGYWVALKMASGLSQVARVAQSIKPAQRSARRTSLDRWPYPSIPCWIVLRPW